MTVGLVCPRCDALADLDSARCPACQTPLGGAAPSALRPGSNGAMAPENLMSNPMTKSCPTCGNQVPIDDRFCGKCGNRLEVADAPVGGKTMFFAGVQPVGRAKLVLVKGDSVDGVAYQLNGSEHVLGRT